MMPPKCYTWLESCGSQLSDGKNEKLFFCILQSVGFSMTLRTDIFLYTEKLSYSDLIYPIIYEFIYGKNLNKDFTNTIRGGGVTILWKFFVKFRFFLKDGFPYKCKHAEWRRQIGNGPWDPSCRNLYPPFNHLRKFPTRQIEELSYGLCECWWGTRLNRAYVNSVSPLVGHFINTHRETQAK